MAPRTAAVPRTSGPLGAGFTIGPRAVRAAGAGLTAYGLAGIALLVIALVVGGAALERVERLSVSLDGTLSAATATSRSSMTALGNLRSGVTQSSTAAGDAGRLVDQASTTSTQLAGAMGVSIFGARPLLPMAASFDDLSSQLDGLSGDLRSIGTALDTSGSDLDGLTAEMQRLTARLEQLSGMNGAAAGVPSGALRVVLLAILAWLAVPAVGALLLGLTLLGLLPRRRANA